jgi:type VI secretion system secreted protein Hcp
VDLILLQPGDGDFFDSAGGTGDGLISGQTDLSGLIEGTGPTIELISMHQSMKQQVTTDVSNPARTFGRPAISDLTCAKYMDAHSVRLYECCLRAKPLDKSGGAPTRIYVLRNSGDQVVNVMTLAIRGAIVTEIEAQSHPDDMLTEQFRLNFTDIVWTYEMAGFGGASPGTLTSGWSVVRNRPITDLDG